MPKYTEWLKKDKLLLLTAWARDGLSDEQLAKNMGIGKSTLYDWKKKHMDFLEAIARGKEVVDIEVENALLKRALGFEYEEITKEGVTGINGEKELRVTKTIRKLVVPDVQAQTMWLKNRKPNVWRDKQEVEHSGEINNPTHESLIEALKNRPIDGLDE